MENKKWIKYWKKSLIDSLKADIDVTKHKYIEVENFDINKSVIPDLKLVNDFINLEETLFNKKKETPKGDVENWVEINEIEVLKQVINENKSELEQIITKLSEIEKDP